MAQSINEAILVGHLGGDPEMRYTPSGRAVCTFRVATNRSFNKEGETVQETDWHNIEVWGRQAEACNAHLSKGRFVGVLGRMQTDSWDGEDGIRRYKTKVVARSVNFLDSGRGSGEEPPQEDIPF